MALPATMKFLLILLTITSTVRATFQASGAPFKSPVKVATGFASRVIFSNLTAPSGITFDDKQNLLVVEIGLGVTAFSQSDINSVAGWERTVVVKNPDLSQGIQVDGKRLFVSTGKAVLVYQYDSATRAVSNSVAPYPIIDGLPADGEFASHPLLFETNPSEAVIGLLVGTGPLTNVDLTARDPASGRSQIRRFIFPTITTDIFPPDPIHWTNGQVIAYGIRNPAGFAFPTGPSIIPVGQKSLYVAENGASLDNVLGFTPQFANDNPADELNYVTYPTSTLLSTAPKSYGFPDCTTLWNSTADPVGSPQYVGMQRGDQISLNLADTRDDSWCRKTPDLNQPPSLSFQAHSAPGDIKFYTPPMVLSSVSLPITFKDSAFVSFFGSFNRSPPTGYGVVQIPFPLSKFSASNSGYSYIIQAQLLNTCPGNCITPVGLAFGADGRLYVSSTLSGELFTIERSQIIQNWDQSSEQN